MADAVIPPSLAPDQPTDNSPVETSRSWYGRLQKAVRQLSGAVRLASDPEGFLERQRRQFGPTFWLWLPRVDATLVTGDPAGAKQIFQCTNDVFDAPRGQPLEPVFGQHSIVLNAGDAHRRQRGLLLPAFRRERMEAFGELMQQITHETLGHLQPGQTCFGHDLTQEITLRTIIRAIFGVTEPNAVNVMEAAMIRFLQTYTPPLMLLPFLRHSMLSGGQWTRFLRARQHLDDLLDHHIAARRSDPQPGVDILSQLIHMTDEAGQRPTNTELKDQLRTMLVAGHDTTAAALAWALFYLHSQPVLLERLLNELIPLGPRPSPAQLHSLPFFDAVCQESLRLHPPVPLVMRQVKQPLHLGGHLVRPGENIAVALRLLHTAEDVWEDGSEFRPERFLGRVYAPWQFAPFGGGGRRCIGAAFANFELRVVLGTMLTAAEFETASPLPSKARFRSIIIVPHNRVPLRYCGPRSAAR